jgi:hypothetical protein
MIVRLTLEIPRGFGARDGDLAVMHERRTGRRIGVWKITEPEILEVFNGKTAVAFFEAKGFGDDIKIGRRVEDQSW